jgi:phosphoglycerol transferase MdoB-like AlkP superfamily enzyme
MLPTFFKVALKRLALLLVAYTLCRLLFLIWNHSQFNGVFFPELALAFGHGLRFDISAILLTNLPWLLMWVLLPSRLVQRKIFVAIDLVLFASINIFCLGLNFIDTEFVKFVGKRMSFDIFLLREDIQRQAVTILLSYWYFCLAVLFLGYLIIRFAPRLPAQSAARKVSSAFFNPAQVFWRVLAAGLIVTGIRGGYQFKPLHPMDAYFSNRRELGLLALNTPYTILRSRQHGQVARFRYFAEDSQAHALLKAQTKLSRPPIQGLKDWNVVVLIIESFGTEYTGAANVYPGFTPFFDSLTKRPNAYFFKQNYANARRSIEGLPAIMCGLPSITESPILTSDFSQNQFTCLPSVLAQRNYSTYFLHGAHNGSMHFDSFARIAGFANYVGLNEFPKKNSEDIDAHWGVLDEPMLQFALDVIDQAPKPTLLSLFTLSSHHPYFIPPKYKGQFPKGTLEIHESIGYTDMSLKKFFTGAEKKPWYNNTIFILTADHTQKSEHKEYQTTTGQYRVPLLVYIPGLAKRLPMDADRITQQIDIVPTVLDLLGYQGEGKLLVGQSVFDAGREGRAFNFNGVSYWHLDPHALVELRGGQEPALVFAKHANVVEVTPADNTETFASSVQFLKAAIQYLTEGLVNNSLYSWR